MEVPEELKNLYRHWPGHTTDTPHTNRIIQPEVRAFIEERIRIWEKKTSGEKPPYTNDLVLARYRFCNIFRELDRQTIEIHTHLHSLRDDFPLWLLNMFYARMVARPETVRSVGLLSFDEEENKSLYRRLMKHSRPRFGTPYVFPISVIQKSTTPTREQFITSYLPHVMEHVADEIQSWDHRSVFEGVRRVVEIFGFNLHFLWTEVLIDVSYQFPEYIDLFKKFPIGPGAEPTFKRLWPDHDPVLCAEALSAASITTTVTYHGKPLALSAENWEGIACEYRKYGNLQNGRGRKRIYRSLT